jgi:hypothetical protein
VGEQQQTKRQKRLPKSGATRRCKACFATTRRTAFLAEISKLGESENPAMDCQKNLTPPLYQIAKISRAVV